MKVNAEKPGRGNFVVRIEGRDDPVVELLAMKRPFAALKALEMDDVGQQIIDAMKSDGGGSKDEAEVEMKDEKEEAKEEEPKKEEAEEDGAKEEEAEKEEPKNDADKKDDA